MYLHVVIKKVILQFNSCKDQPLKITLEPVIIRFFRQLHKLERESVTTKFCYQYAKSLTKNFSKEISQKNLTIRNTL